MTREELINKGFAIKYVNDQPVITRNGRDVIVKIHNNGNGTERFRTYIGDHQYMDIKLIIKLLQQGD